LRYILILNQNIDQKRIFTGVTNLKGYMTKGKVISHREREIESDPASGSKKRSTNLKTILASGSYRTSPNMHSAGFGRYLRKPEENKHWHQGISKREEKKAQ